MLTTKNYTISSTGQHKVNLNYAAVGQISDQKSHRFIKFGLRLHLSLENLNCDNNTSNNTPLPLTDSDNHHHHNSSAPGIMENNKNKSQNDTSSSPIIETVANYLVKLTEYFHEFETLKEQPDNNGSGVNSLRELSWETAGVEQQLSNSLNSLRSRIPSKVNELIDNGKDYAKSNPLTFLTIVALGLSCSLPIFVFLAFAIITVAFTFVGFLFVEGTILTFASVVLTSVVLLVGFFTLTITSLLILTYLGLNTFYKLCTGSPLSETNPIKTIVQYLSSSSQEETQNRNGDVVNHTDEPSSEDEVVAQID